MFVRTLIGRQAGTIIDMPFTAAQACIDVGTAERVTDDEIAAAGLAQPATATVATPEDFPRGYRGEPDEVKGFHVIDPGGVNLTIDSPLPNLAAARAFAWEKADPNAGVSSEKTPEQKLMEQTRAQLEALAGEKGIDITTAKNKADIVALLLDPNAPKVQAAPPTAEQLAAMSHDDLVKLAADREVKIDGLETDADIVAAIQLDIEQKSKA